MKRVLFIWVAAVIGVIPISSNADASATCSYGEIKVLTYNTFLLPDPIFIFGRSKRAAMIPAQIKGYDVVVVQEAFNKKARDILIQGMKCQGYKNSSFPLNKKIALKENSGVIIFTKEGISLEVIEKNKKFEEACDGNDCKAGKGVAYVKVKKSGKVFHIFGTHLNVSNRPVQIRQLKIMKDLIDQQNIVDEPILMAGDFNIDRYGHDYELMLGMLEAGYPEIEPGEFTFDSNQNNLIVKEGLLYIDYVLYAKRYPPRKAEIAVVKPLASDPWLRKASSGEEVKDLSDHYAVSATYCFDQQ